MGEDEANGGPGDEHPLQSVLSHDSESLLKLLSDEIECKSKRVVLKFGMAYWRHSQTQLLEFIHLYIVDLIVWQSV